MKTIVTLTLAACLVSQVALAQYVEDVLRYSQPHVFGNSQSIGLGNAVGAVGANGVDMIFNPAGLGFYRNSMVNVTLNTNSTSNVTTYLNNTVNNINNNVQIKGFNIVLASVNQNYNGNERSKGLISGAFGIGINQRSNFRNQYTVVGKSSLNSFAGSMALSANDNGIFESTYENLAYQAYIIEYDSSKSKYIGLGQNGGMSQTEKNFKSGSLSDFDIGGGLNYDNKFYVGASINISSIDYLQDVSFVENNISDTTYIYNLSKYTLIESYSQTGSALQLKLGAIYRPVDFFRIGFSFHSGKTYRITETGTSYLYSEDDSNTYGTFQNSQDAINYTYTFKLHTPAKTNINAAIYFGKYGFLSLDAERIAYASSFVRNKFDISLESSNQTVINNTYQTANNFRAGIELRPVPYIAIRGGIQSLGDPYKSSTIDDGRMIYSGGMGFKYQQYGFDVYYAYQQRNQFRALYQYGTYQSDPVNIFTENQQFGFTFTYQY